VDPSADVRVQSPYDDIFVREEHFRIHVPGTGGVQRSGPRRLSVISEDDQQVLLDRAFERGPGSHTEHFERYEWRDVTDDGEPEFLLWTRDEGMRHSRRLLTVYQVGPRERDALAGKSAGIALTKVFRKAFEHRTWQTYPTTVNMIGTFIFEKGEASAPAVVWTPSPGNKEERAVTRWVWAPQRRAFVPPTDAATDF
jgi:hypothetical protein